MINFPICSAETWFSLLFTVLVEIVPASIRSVSIGAFLFLMNNVGGNLPLLVDPLAKMPGVGLQTALYISWPGLTAASETHFQSRKLLYNCPFTFHYFRWCSVPPFWCISVENQQTNVLERKQENSNITKKHQLL